MRMMMVAAAVLVMAALMMGCSSSSAESINRVVGMEMGMESWEEEMMELNMMMVMSGREEFVDAAGYGEEKLSKVIITGKVVCHHHAQQPPHPVSGASVAILCEGGRNRKTQKSAASGSAGEDGDFVIDLPSHLHAIPNLEDVCLVRVLHLPTHSKCHPEFKPKHQEIELHSVHDGGARTYTTNTIDLTLTAKPSKAHTAKHSKTRRYSTKNRKHGHHAY